MPTTDYLPMWKRSYCARRAAPRLSPEEFDRLIDEEGSTGPSPAGSFSRAEIDSDHD
jgi:hypothetical protein